MVARMVSMIVEVVRRIFCEEKKQDGSCLGYFLDIAAGSKQRQLEGNKVHGKP